MALDDYYQPAIEPKAREQLRKLAAAILLENTGAAMRAMCLRVLNGPNARAAALDLRRLMEDLP